MNDDPFATVESALEFLTLFDAAIASTLEDVRGDLLTASARRQRALSLAVYKLERLQYHTGRSKRMANDLRILRRLLLDERTPVQATSRAALVASGL